MHVAAAKTETPTFTKHARPRHRFSTSFPPTPVERAMTAVRWERRGLLGRLVRLDDPVQP
jgi:hypothetical protein